MVSSLEAGCPAWSEPSASSAGTRRRDRPQGSGCGWNPGQAGPRSAALAVAAERRRPQKVRPAQQCRHRQLPAKNVSRSPSSCKSIWLSSLVWDNDVETASLQRPQGCVRIFRLRAFQQPCAFCPCFVRLLVRQTAFCGLSGSGYPGPCRGTSPSLPRPQSWHQRMLNARAPAPWGPPAPARLCVVGGRRLASLRFW